MNKHRQHLEETGWTYWQHLHHSIVVCSRLMKIVVLGLLHGLFPAFWANKGPVGIYRLFKDMRRLRHTQKYFEAEDQRQQYGQNKNNRV